MANDDDIHVYILRCADGSYYTGSTRSSLEQRLDEHNKAQFDGYTAARRPAVLVWSQVFQQVTDAISAQRQIKGWTRRKKEALIAGKLDLLPALAKKPPRRSRP